MKIAFCTDVYLPTLSGVADSVAGLVAEMQKCGHEVRIYAPSYKNTLPDKNIVRLPSYSVPGSHESLMFVFPKGMLKDLRSFKPDIIHTHTFSTVGLAALFASFRLCVPIVGTDHTFPALYLRYVKLDFALFRFIVKKFAAWYYNRCDFVTTPSKSMMDELKEYKMRKPSLIISNPVILNLFKPSLDRLALRKKHGINKPAILLFGRVSPEKKLDFAIDIFSEVLYEIDAELIILGDGPHRKVLEEKVKNENIKNVRFLGIKRGEELVEIINATDVFVLTSLENQPMTMLQTMACGLPIVGPDFGGSIEYIHENKTGFIVSKDDKKAFAQKIIYLLKNPAIAREFGENGRVVVKTFSPENVGNMFIKVYNTVIKKKSENIGNNT